MSTNPDVPQLPDLPTDVLQALLGFVSLQQRLGTCALVQRRWYAAAGAVTNSIQLQHMTPEQLASLMIWLKQHGQHATSLELCVPRPNHRDKVPTLSLTALPCLHLRELRLKGFKLRLAAEPLPMGGRPGLLHACSHLTHLRLSHCTLLHPQESRHHKKTPVQHAGLAALAALPSLQHLSLAALTWTKQPMLSLTFPGRLMSQLLQLTHLHVGMCVHEDSWQHIGCLTGLQELSLGPYAEPPALTNPTQLPQLTKLYVHGTWGWHVYPSERLAIACFLQHLTGLQSLVVLDCCPVQPGGLVSMHQLRHLEWCQGYIEPEAMMAVLEWLPTVRQLSSLVFSWATNEADPLAAFTALVSCSELEHLCVEPRSLMCVGTQPAGVWQHMFPQGRQLLKLHMLVVRQKSAPMAACDLACVVQCCPALQHLEVASLLPGIPLTDLTQLQHLRCLHVNGVSKKTIKHLAQLSSVTKLFVSSFGVQYMRPADGPVTGALPRLQRVQKRYALGAGRIQHLSSLKMLEHLQIETARPLSSGNGSHTVPASRPSMITSFTNKVITS